MIIIEVPNQKDPIVWEAVDKIDFIKQVQNANKKRNYFRHSNVTLAANIEALDRQIAEELLSKDMDSADFCKDFFEKIEKAIRESPVGMAVIECYQSKTSIYPQKEDDTDDAFNFWWAVASHDRQSMSYYENIDEALRNENTGPQYAKVINMLRKLEKHS